MSYLNRMKFFCASIFLVSLGVNQSAFAKKSAKADKKQQIVEEVFTKYKVAKLVTLDVKKKVKSELLGKVQVYEGQIFVAQKYFRWDTETPDKSQIIFDGTNIWNVQYPPKEMKANVNVAKMKLDNNSKKQILISSLLNQEPISKNFKILKETNQDQMTQVDLEPKKNDMKIQNLLVQIDLKTKNLSLISYLDDLGNKIEIEITKTTFAKSANSKLFKYQPPKGASVTNL